MGQNIREEQYIYFLFNSHFKLEQSHGIVGHTQDYYRSQRYSVWAYKAPVDPLRLLNFEESDRQYRATWTRDEPLRCMRLLYIE